LTFEEFGMNKNKVRFGVKKSFLSIIFFALSASAFAANTVTGVVYDNKNNPLIDVDVELLDDLGAYKQHQRTDSTGRYSFSGLADGRFSVRVMPFRYDFEQATRDITFSTFNVTGGTGSSTEIVDFNLSPRKNGLAYSEAQVIFAQETPETAKRAFNRGESALKKKDLAGSLTAFEEAITIFPTYFAGLYQLGELYFAKQDYGKSAYYLLRAADVNNKSPKSFYILGYSLYMLKMYPSALVALNQAINLSPASGEILLLLGTTEIKEGKFTEAEKHLKQVKKVSTTPNPEVYWQLSQLYGNYLKRYAEAADELENYLKAQTNINTPDQKKKAEEYKKIIKQLKEKAVTSAKS
jgi:tetratricopeptide (TPR) repeat protein